MAERCPRAVPLCQEQQIRARGNWHFGSSDRRRSNCSWTSASGRTRRGTRSRSSCWIRPQGRRPHSLGAFGTCRTGRRRWSRRSRSCRGRSRSRRTHRRRSAWRDDPRTRDPERRTGLARFGPLDELPRISPDNPTGRIEIVIGPPQSFTAADLNRWFGASLPQHTTTALTGDVPGNVEPTVDAGVSARAKHDSAGGSGTANVTGAPWGSQLLPFEVGSPSAFACRRRPRPTACATSR